MAVSPADLLAKAQLIIDKQAQRGISVATSADKLAEYNAAHAKAAADDAEYAAAFDDFVNASHDFNKDVIDIP